MNFPRITRTSRLVTYAGVLLTAAAITAAAPPAGAAAGTAASNAAAASSASTTQGFTATGAAGLLAASTFKKGPGRITCEMVFIGENGGVPHHSGHKPGTVNVRVRVTCNRPIARIKASLALFNTVGSPIQPYGSVGQATARANVARVCATGNYQGVSIATLTAPAGYTPHTAKLSGSTRLVHIDKNRDCK